MNFVIRPVARLDILRQYRSYLEEQNASPAAERFLSAVEKSIQKICTRPQTGAPKRMENGRLQGLRSYPVEGFPKLRIYYIVQPDHLQVVRILHGKRDLGTILTESEP